MIQMSMSSCHIFVVTHRMTSCALVVVCGVNWQPKSDRPTTSRSTISSRAHVVWFPFRPKSHQRNSSRRTSRVVMWRARASPRQVESRRSDQEEDLPGPSPSQVVGRRSDQDKDHPGPSPSRAEGRRSDQDKHHPGPNPIISPTIPPTILPTILPTMHRSDNTNDLSFDDDEWDKLVVCEVEEDNGVWKRCTIFSLKSSHHSGSEVCLYFGNDEYEGLPPDTYTLDKNRNVLYDSENDKINIRNVVYMKHVQLWKYCNILKTNKNYDFYQYWIHVFGYTFTHIDTHTLNLSHTYTYIHNNITLNLTMLKK